MKRTWWCLLGFAVALALVFSACAAPKAPTPAPVSQGPVTRSPAPAGPTTASREQLSEAARKEGEVIIWGNTLPAEEVWKPFREKYPFIKIKFWDASTGADAINKIVEEGKVGRVSGDILFLGAEIGGVAAMGLLQEYDWKVRGWPGQPPHKYYISYTGNPRLPAYNTNVIPPAAAPKSWEDLSLPKWRDYGPVTSFSSPEGALYLGYMWREDGKINWEKAEKFLTDMVKNNRPKVVRGFSGPNELLATGEYGIFMPYSSGRDILQMIVKGAPLAPVPVGKVPVYLRSVGIIKGSPHPNASRLFADWFAAEGGHIIETNATMSYTIDPELARVAPGNRLLTEKYKIEGEPVPQEAMTVENIKRATDWWLKLIGAK